MTQATFTHALTHSSLSCSLPQVIVTSDRINAAVTLKDCWKHLTSQDRAAAQGPKLFFGGTFYRKSVANQVLSAFVMERFDAVSNETVNS